MLKGEHTKQLILEGKTNEEILKEIDTTLGSVKWHRNKVSPRTIKEIPITKKPLKQATSETLELVKEILKKEVLFVRQGFLISGSYSGQEMTPQLIKNYIRYLEKVEKKDTVILNKLPLEEAAAIYEKLKTKD